MTFAAVAAVRCAAGRAVAAESVEVHPKGLVRELAFCLFPQRNHNDFFPPPP